MRKKGFTAVELVLVLVVLAIVVSVTMVQVDKRRQARFREESQQNLSALQVIVKAPYYMDFSGNRFGSEYLSWPPLSRVVGRLAPEPTDELIESPWMLKNPTAFISPAHPDADRMRRAVATDLRSSWTDESYWYLRFQLHDEETGLRFVQAYKETVALTGSPPTEDRLSLVTGPNTNTAVAFAFGLVIDYTPSEKVPVFIERPRLQRGGSNVLWSDGTVEFIPYPGPWPMTEKFIKALESLDELKEKKPSASEK